MVLDPTSLQDSDGDGLTDWQETYQYKTSPIVWDSDGDKVGDGDEIADGTDPNDASNFDYNLTVCITNDVPTVPELRCSVFNNESSSEPILSSSIPTNFINCLNFDHLHVTSNSNPLVSIWYDANTNEIYDVGEWSKVLNYKPDSHHVVTSLRLSKFADSGEGIPGYWWLANGVTNSSDRVATADLDGDGLINLHEFWTGTQPLQRDGTNTLLSILSRSVDERLCGRSPTNSLDVYVDYVENGYSTNFVLNSASWLQGVDLSCCSMWTATNGCAFGPTTTPVTVISPRHVIYAHHFNYLDSETRLETMPIGKAYFFRGRSGIVYERHLVGKRGVAGDIAIGLLDCELPTNDVSVAKIFRLLGGIRKEERLKPRPD